MLKLNEMAETYHARLFDLFWFMWVHNESLSRQANAEDDCTRRFCEGRFKSQALLDEQALLTAIAYVDLNLVRAGMAELPETSDYTSIQERPGCKPAMQSDQCLSPVPQPWCKHRSCLLTPPGVYPGPFLWAGRTMPSWWIGRGGWCICTKKAAVADSPALLARLGLDGEAFIAMAATFLREFGPAVGTPAHMALLCAHRQTRFLRGMQVVRRVVWREVKDFVRFEEAV